MGETGGCVNVNWPVAGGWVPTPELVDTLGIAGYSLMETKGIIYKYTLTFQTVPPSTFDYTFDDASGDSYVCNTWQDGFHYINYNSDDPTIVYICAE